MTEHYTDQGHLLIRNSDIKDGYFEFGENPIYLDEEFFEQNKSRMHQLGDVITVHTGDIGTSAVIGENEVGSIGFATIVTRPNQEVLDSGYFATYLNTDTHKRWAISMATGDGRSNYNLKDYTKLVVPIPQIEEQKKIAACIGNLNNLITLHQHKLFPILKSTFLTPSQIFLKSVFSTLYQPSAPPVPNPSHEVHDMLFLKNLPGSSSQPLNSVYHKTIDNMHKTPQSNLA